MGVIEVECCVIFLMLFTTHDHVDMITYFIYHDKIQAFGFEDGSIKKDASVNYSVRQRKECSYFTLIIELQHFL